ncbi:MAG: N-acetylglucosamine-6-phosphate deacetylase [Bacillota bacterium]
MYNAKILIKNRIIEDGWLIINEDKITGIGEGRPEHNNYQSKINLDGLYLAPGLIDIHCHGGNGYDVMDKDRDVLKKISEYKLNAGVTGWLATPLTAPPAELENVCKSIIKEIQAGKSPNLLGAHVEGPFISQAKKGAQNPKFIRDGALKEINRWIDILGKYLRIVTLAPEKPGAEAIINRLKENKTLVATAHTAASYEEMTQAIKAGVEQASHFYNGMTGFHHRNPGTVGAFLDSDETTMEIIADGIHLHPATIRITLKLAGPERIILITDAMRAAGMEDGSYDLGGLQVSINNGEARLKDGSLAGSTLKLIEAVKYIYNNTELDLVSSWQLASYNPAKRLGLDNYYGSLEAGKVANIVAFDSQFNIKNIWLKGSLR